MVSTNKGTKNGFAVGQGMMMHSRNNLLWFLGLNNLLWKRNRMSSISLTSMFDKMYHLPLDYLNCLNSETFAILEVEH